MKTSHEDETKPEQENDPSDTSTPSKLDDSMFDEQEPQDWLDAEQEVQRMLGIEDCDVTGV